MEQPPSVQFSYTLPLKVLLNQLLDQDNEVRNGAELYIKEKSTSSGFLYSLIAYACTSSDATGGDMAESFIMGDSNIGKDSDDTNNTMDSPNGESIEYSTATLIERGDDAPAFAEELDKTPHATISAESIARRTLAAVLGKQIVRERWKTVWETERASIKALLLQHLIRLPPTVRPTIHVIVADIAASDGPTLGWKVLFPTIRYIMNQCRERHLTDGIAALLDLLLAMAQPDEPGELLAQYILDIEHGVQDALLHLAQGMRQFNFAKQYEEVTIPAGCRRKCLHVYQLCVRAVLDKGVSHQIDEFIIPNISQWNNVLLSIVDELSDAPTDLNAIQNALTVLRCLATFFCGKALSIEKESFTCLRTSLEKCLEILDLYYPFYENMVINDRDGNALVEETIEGGPTTFLVQLCDLLVTCVHRHRLRTSLIKGHVRDTLGAVVKYLQINEAQKQVWLLDSNEYLFHELEGGRLELSTRIAGERLICILLEEFEEETVEGLMESTLILFKIFDDNSIPDTMQESDLWKFLELGLWLIGLVASTEHVKELYSRSELEATVLRVGQVLGNISSPPLLRARSLWTATKLQHFLIEKYPNDISSLLFISAQAIDSQESPPVRVAACRALDTFLAVCPTTEMKTLILFQRRVLENLADFLATASEDSLRLGLELLTRITAECPSAVEAVKETFLPLILEIWRRSSEDPLVNLYFQDFLSAACQSSHELRESLENQLVPIIMKTLRASGEHQGKNIDSHELGVSLDLYSVLIRTGSHPLHSSLWDGFELIMIILMNVEEPSVVQTGCEALALLIITAPEKIRAENKLRDILNFCERLLSSSSGLEDRAALMAGPLLQVFIRQFGADLPSDLIQHIFSAMLTRMVTAQVPALQQSLMIVFSRFVCHSPEQMFDILQSITIPLDNQQISGLILFVQFWLQILPNAESILHNRYARNVTYSALITLLTYRLTFLQNSSLTTDIPSQVLYLLIKGLKSLCDYDLKQKSRRRRNGTKATNMYECNSMESTTNEQETLLETSTQLDSISSLSNNQQSSNTSITHTNEAHHQQSSVSSSSVEILPETSSNQQLHNTEWNHRSSDISSGISEDEIAETFSQSTIGCSRLYHSIFSEEEEKDNFTHLDIKAILFSELQQFWESQTNYRTIFHQLDPLTLEAWHSCLQNCSPTLQSEKTLIKQVLVSGTLTLKTGPSIPQLPTPFSSPPRPIQHPTTNPTEYHLSIE